MIRRLHFCCVRRPQVGVRLIAVGRESDKLGDIAFEHMQVGPFTKGNGDCLQGQDLRQLSYPKLGGELPGWHIIQNDVLHRQCLKFGHFLWPLRRVGIMLVLRQP